MATLQRQGQARGFVTSPLTRLPPPAVPVARRNKTTKAPYSILSERVAMAEGRAKAIEDAQPDGVAGAFGRGLGVVMNNPLTRAVLAPLNELDKMRRLLTLGVEEFSEAVTGQEMPRQVDPETGELLDKRSNWDKINDPSYGVGQLLREMSWDDSLGNIGDKAVGFVGDAILDPLSYVGGIGFANKAAAAGGRAARAGVMSGLLNAARREGVEEIPEVLEKLQRVGVRGFAAADEQMLKDAGIRGGVRMNPNPFTPSRALDVTIPGSERLTKPLSAARTKVGEVLGKSETGRRVLEWRTPMGLEDSYNRIFRGQGPESLDDALDQVYEYMAKNKHQGAFAAPLQAKADQFVHEIRKASTSEKKAILNQVETPGVIPTGHAAELSNQLAGVRQAAIDADPDMTIEKLENYATHIPTKDAIRWRRDTRNAGKIKAPTGFFTESVYDPSGVTMNRKFRIGDEFEVNGHPIKLEHATIDEVNTKFRKAGLDFDFFESDPGIILQKYINMVGDDVAVLKAARDLDIESAGKAGIFWEKRNAEGLPVTRSRPTVLEGGAKIQEGDLDAVAARLGIDDGLDSGVYKVVKDKEITKSTNEPIRAALKQEGKTARTALKAARLDIDTKLRRIAAGEVGWPGAPSLRADLAKRQEAVTDISKRMNAANKALNETKQTVEQLTDRYIYHDDVVRELGDEIAAIDLNIEAFGSDAPKELDSTLRKQRRILNEKIAEAQRIGKEARARIDARHASRVEAEEWIQLRREELYGNAGAPVPQSGLLPRTTPAQPVKAPLVGEHPVPQGHQLAAMEGGIARQMMAGEDPAEALAEFAAYSGRDPAEIVADLQRRLGERYQAPAEVPVSVPGTEMAPEAEVVPEVKAPKEPKPVSKPKPARKKLTSNSETIDEMRAAADEYRKQALKDAQDHHDHLFGENGILELPGRNLNEKGHAEMFGGNANVKKKNVAGESVQGAWANPESPVWVNRLHSRQWYIDQGYIAETGHGVGLDTLQDHLDLALGKDVPAMQVAQMYLESIDRQIALENPRYIADDIVDKVADQFGMYGERRAVRTALTNKQKYIKLVNERADSDLDSVIKAIDELDEVMRQGVIEVMRQEPDNMAATVTDILNAATGHSWHEYSETLDATDANKLANYLEANPPKAVVAEDFAKEVEEVAPPMGTVGVTPAPFEETPAEGMVRLYRGEAVGPKRSMEEVKQARAERGLGWIDESPEMKTRDSVQGRWFTTDKDLANKYPTNRDPDELNQLTYVDIPVEDYERLKGLAGQPDDVRSLSRDIDSEVVLPPEMLARVQPHPVEEAISVPRTETPTPSTEKVPASQLGDKYEALVAKRDSITAKEGQVAANERRVPELEKQLAQTKAQVDGMKRRYIDNVTREELDAKAATQRQKFADEMHAETDPEKIEELREKIANVASADTIYKQYDNAFAKQRNLERDIAKAKKDTPELRKEIRILKEEEAKLAAEIKSRRIPPEVHPGRDPALVQAERDARLAESRVDTTPSLDSQWQQSNIVTPSKRPWAPKPMTERVEQARVHRIQDPKIRERLEARLKKAERVVEGKENRLFKARRKIKENEQITDLQKRYMQSFKDSGGITRSKVDVPERPFPPKMMERRPARVNSKGKKLPADGGNIVMPKSGVMNLDEEQWAAVNLWSQMVDDAMEGRPIRGSYPANLRGPQGRQIDRALRAKVKELQEALGMPGMQRELQSARDKWTDIKALLDRKEFLNDDPASIAALRERIAGMTDKGERQTLLDMENELRSPDTVKAERALNKEDAQSAVREAFYEGKMTERGLGISEQIDEIATNPEAREAISREAMEQPLPRKLKAQSERLQREANASATIAATTYAKLLPAEKSFVELQAGMADIASRQMDEVKLLGETKGHLARVKKLDSKARGNQPVESWLEGILKDDPGLKQIDNQATVFAINEAEKMAERIEPLLLRVENSKLSVNGEQMSRALNVVLADTVSAMIPDITGPNGPLIKDSLRRAMENTRQVTSDSNFWRHVDNLTGLFKTYATLSPGFHTRNAMSGSFMNASEGISVSDQARGASLVREYHRAINNGEVDQFLAKQGKVVLNKETGTTVQDAFDAVAGTGVGGRYREHGVGDRSLARNKLNERLYENALTYNVGKRPGGFIEDALRLPVALDTLKRGGSVDDAVNRITRVHFDYSQVSAFDQKMRRMIPFWTFMSRNLPLQMAQMYTKPRAFAKYNNFMRNFRGEGNPGEPDYFKKIGAFQWGDTKIGGLPMYLQPDLAHTRLQEDFTKIEDLLSLEQPSRLLSDFNPLFTAPAEFVLGENFYTGKQYDDSDVRELGNIEKPIELLARIFNQTQTTPGGKTVVNEKFIDAIRSVVPIYDRSVRLAPGAVTGSADEDAKARQIESYLRFLGIPVRQLSQAQQRSTIKGRQYDLMDQRDLQRTLASIDRAG